MPTQVTLSRRYREWSDFALRDSGDVPPAPPRVARIGRLRALRDEDAVVRDWPAPASLRRALERAARELVRAGLIAAGPLELCLVPLPLDGLADGEHRTVLIDPGVVEGHEDPVTRDLLIHELLHFGHDTTGGEHGAALREITTTALSYVALCRMYPSLAPLPEERDALRAFALRTYPQGFVLPALVEVVVQRGALRPLPLLERIIALHTDRAQQSFFDRAVEEALSRAERTRIDTEAAQVRALRPAAREHAQGLHRWCGHDTTDRLLLAIGLRLRHALASGTPFEAPLLATADGPAAVAEGAAALLAAASSFSS